MYLLFSSNNATNMTKIRYRCMRLSLSFSSNQVVSIKKAVNKTIVLAWLTMSREEKSSPFYRLWGGLTYFDIEITWSNQQKRYEIKNVKETQTHFDWATLFLCQSRSILPKSIKGGDFFSTLSICFTLLGDEGFQGFMWTLWR